MTRTAFSSLFVLAFAAAFSGCSQQSSVTGGVVSIEGQVLEANGSPAANREVKLWDHDLGDLLIFPILLFPHDRGMSDSAGNYTLHQDGNLANGFFGARQFRVEIKAAKWEEPSIDVLIRLYSQTQPVPTVQIWEGNGASKTVGDDVELSWDTLSGASSYDAGLYLDRELIRFERAGAATTARVPARLLQDWTVHMVPTATLRVAKPDQTFKVLHRGRAHTIPNQNLVPVTRNELAATDGAGLVRELTDGQLKAYEFGGRSGPVTRRIEIDLGTVRSLSEVYLYNLSLESSGNGLPLGAVTVSLDLLPGQTVASRTPQASALSLATVILRLPANASGRYLVIETQDPQTHFTQLDELAAF